MICLACVNNMKAITTKVVLSDGNRIPLFGLGCWRLDGSEAYESALGAIKEGYRLFDTAARYQNEDVVGKALRESCLSRDDFFVVTKLSHHCHGYYEAKAALRESLHKLRLKYVNLFLIHNPQPGRNIETWKALVELKQEGLTKSIGVSNFNVQHLEPMLATGMEPPAVNQIELHPWNQQEKAVEFCRKNNIAVMGYCPIARGRMFEDGKYPAIDNLSKKHNKTKAQIVLRWAIQEGFITIPKSSNPKRIKENCEIFDFELSDNDMKLINQLNEDVEISNVSFVMNESWTG